MANAVLFDVLHAVRARIAALELSIAPANIVVQKVLSSKLRDLPADRFPMIAIAPRTEIIDKAAGTNSRDDVYYPVTVAILASEKNEAAQPVDKQQQNFNQYLLWREQIRQSFHNQPLGSTAFTGYVIPLDVVDPVAFDNWSIYASGLVLCFGSREGRL